MSFVSIERLQGICTMQSCLVLGLLLAAVIGYLLRSRSRIRAELALREAELAEARKAVERRSRFVSTAAHEIRTPLNGIIGFAELLTRARSMAEVNEYASVVASSSVYLRSLVTDILDLSKLEAGGIKPRLTECNPVAVVRSALDLFMLSAQRKGLRLQMEAESDLPPSIRTDPELLERVLINLLSNAIKHTSEGVVTCRVAVEANHCVFEVEDAGEGIPEERLDQVFEPFNALSSKYRSQADEPSTGLGLALSKELAYLLGGDLTVTSCRGIGTVFRLTVRHH